MAAWTRRQPLRLILGQHLESGIELLPEPMKLHPLEIRKLNRGSGVGSAVTRLAAHDVHVDATVSRHGLTLCWNNVPRSQ